MKPSLKELWDTELKRIAALKKALKERKYALASTSDIITTFKEDIDAISFNYMEGMTIQLKSGGNYRPILSKLVKKFGKFTKTVLDNNYGRTADNDKVFLHFESVGMEPFIMLEIGNPASCKVVYKKQIIPAHTVEEKVELIATIECK